jgi:MiaB-like tRNA modifying enzyme
MKVYIETYGCTMNQGDSEIIRALVPREHELVGDPRECDVVVINSCGVIRYTERKILRRVSILKDSGKKVLVTGCLPKINVEGIVDSGADAILPARGIGYIGEALQELSRNKRFLKDEENGFEKAGIPKVRGSSSIAIVPIAEGCLGGCSYCATRFARGRLRSFELERIVKEVEECVARGYRELQLTAQDTAVYGRDKGGSLPELLRRVCEIKGEFRIRIGMMNPRYAVEILDELIEACRDEKVYKFFHIPLQSGDDRVLRHMNRGYTVGDFIGIVKALMRNFPRLTISTDVIVGYPTESKESFQKTYDLIGAIKPDILNITRFSPRPGTGAFGLKDMPDRYKKERSRKLTSLHKNISLKINKKLIGKEFDVLITENGKNDSLLGRTDFYKQVVIKNGIIGEIKKTRIIDAKYNYLIGN